MKTRMLSTMLVGIIPIVLLAPSALAGLDPTAVKTTPRDESRASGNANYFAWTRDTAGDPLDIKVWVQPTGLSPYPVDFRGKEFSGQMDPNGDTLPYTRVLNGTADIRLFDMAAQQLVALPPGINTNKWETWPARSGNRLTFVRDGRRTETLFLVTDLSTGDKIALKQLDERRATFANIPKINGNWVTWAVCNQQGCHAYRYDIDSDLTEQIPNPLGLFYFAPSPDLAGNVYFERSRPQCGRAARMMKWTGAGDPTVFYSFPRGSDMTGSMTFDNGAGMITVFVDFFDCGTGEGDIYSFTNP
jgi:hypothetical protein